MAFSLSSADVQQAQQAQARMQAGDPAAAAALTGALIARGVRHADLFGLHAAACRAIGAFEQARGALAQATALAPGNAALWSSYASLLDDLGESDGAIAAYERAVAARPDFAAAWMNLGLAASAAGRHKLARAALERAAALTPAAAHVWGARGHVEQAAGAPAAAAASLRRALSLDPELASARHNLAAALRSLDEPEAALSQLAPIAPDRAAPETLTLRAHLLAELGRFDEAVAEYRGLLAAHPGQIDAQETFARLLPQLGRGEEALAGYEAGLVARPDDFALWRSALATARALARSAELLRWSRDAQARLGPQREFVIAEAHALGLSGVPQAALRLLEPLAAGDAEAATYAAYWRLRSGDPQAAERHALNAATQAPLAQSAWAYLTIIWRLLDDDREHWLADYERLVMPVDLELDPHELAEIDRALTAMHVMLAHPGEQSLRHGTQTRGNLFDRRAPAIRALADRVGRVIRARLSSLPDDPNHPFLARNTGAADYAGAWSVRLGRSGHHVAHIHPEGWLSSALHVAVPPEVAADDGEMPAGALTFGVPDAALGLSLSPRRIERPTAGRLVLFPSYFWHGTVPFESDRPRLTVAFDARPASRPV